MTQEKRNVKWPEYKQQGKYNESCLEFQQHNLIWAH